MALIIGIDEAGYGPLLGPLVVSAVAISVPKALLCADLWQVLKTSVAKAGRSSYGRLLIDDSKVIFRKRSGMGCLTRSVLAAMLAAGSKPRTLQDLLSTLDQDCVLRLSAYPWHKHMDAKSLPYQDPDIELAGTVLARDLSRNGAGLLAIHSRCIDVVYYNQLVEGLNNKATLLFCLTCSLIKEAMDLSNDQDLLCVIDRQGGRSHYRDRLQTMFPDCKMAIVCEDRRLSSYKLTWPSRTLQIQFLVGADGRHLPVALASMVSKYVRELVLQDINAYFTSLIPDLRPTRGYWQDGMRFIGQIEQMPWLDIKRHLLVRCR